jgi:hypothetical protein
MTAVEACTGSLNVALTGLLVATPVAPVAGVCPEIVGGVVSGGGGVAVVKDQLVATMVLPATSLAPDTVTPYVVLSANVTVGVKVTVWVGAS